MQYGVEPLGFRRRRDARASYRIGYLEQDQVTAPGRAAVASTPRKKGFYSSYPYQDYLSILSTYVDKILEV